MNNFSIATMSDSAVLSILDMKEQIKEDPEYQRPGGVWSIQKRQLFIDSLINGYDIPKIYLHANSETEMINGRFSVIDGRQRLEAIWDFAADKFPLADDFEFFLNPPLKAQNMKYSMLSKEHPRILSKFHARTLSIIIITTSDIDVVEDMFSRLNEAEPLNAAEKRNAFGGLLPEYIRKLSNNKFFTTKVKITDTRYRHHDIVTKMCYLEANDDIVDTKKKSLDKFVKDYRSKSKAQIEELVNKVEITLKEMIDVFQDKDTLLRSSGMVVIYYVLFSRTIRENAALPDRNAFISFDEIRTKNREKFEQDEDDINPQLIEYDELAQSSNDASAIRSRYETLRQYTIK